MRKIKKASIFITSTGRTGTKFFSMLLGEILDACDSFHEPDVLTSSVWDVLPALKQFGFDQIVLDKLSRLRNMQSLSATYAAGKASLDVAAYHVWRLRCRFVSRLPGQVYAESNGQLWGLVDVVAKVFPDSKSIVLVRDGRAWVRSIVSHLGDRYLSRFDLRSRYGKGRLRPSHFVGSEGEKLWDSWDQFQKVCWTWQAKTRQLARAASRVPTARLFKYEDVFLSPCRYAVLADMIDFATRFPSGFAARPKPFHGCLDRKIHKSDPALFPHWRDWPDERVRQFHAICGEVMEELGYGDEPEWRERVERALRASGA